MNIFTFSALQNNSFVAFFTITALLFTFVPAQVAQANHDSNGPYFGTVLEHNASIVVCHWTNENSNAGYVSIPVNINSFVNNNAHNDEHDEDIIPPFHYQEKNGNVITEKEYPGKNWNGWSNAPEEFADQNPQDIYNDCDTPDDTEDPEIQATGTIRVIKNVVGNDIADESDFSFEIDNASTTPFEEDGQNDVVLAVGSYDITEIEPENYTVTYVNSLNNELNCDNLEVTEGETVTCTITNTYISDIDPEDPSATTTATGTLQVVKIIEGNELASSTQFSFQINGASTTAFEADGQNDIVLNVDEYTITEIDPVNYTVTYSNNLNNEANCTSLPISATTTTICTITNTFTPDGKERGTLEVIKVIEGNSNATSSDFSFLINGTATTTFEVDGQNDLVLEVGQYTITEVSVSGYTTEYENCNNVSVTNGGTATCTITNIYDGNDNPGGGDPQKCSITIVSDETNTVVEKDDAFAKAVTFFHDAWTAAIIDATWIWGDDPVADPVNETIQTFTKEFDWNGPVTDVVLEIATDNSYEVRLNGTLIASSTDENNHAVTTQDSYTELEFDTSLIVDGTNELEITVKNWEQGNGTTESNPAGLLYSMTIEGTDEDCDSENEDERFTLTVNITGDGEGNVTDDLEGIACYSEEGELQDCSETHASGTVVVLTATPNEGSNFNNSWTVGAGTCTGNTTPCSVIMDQDRTLTAHFDLNSGGSGGSSSSGGGGGRRVSLRDNETPPGQVLGEQVRVVPVGAPDAGAGGMAPKTAPLSIYTILGFLLGSRTTQKFAYAYTR